MKKYIAIVVLIISLVANVFFLFYKLKPQQQEYARETAMYSKLDSLLVDNFIDRYQNGDKLVVYVGRPSCGDCSKFEEVFDQIIEKYKLRKQLYYVNVEEIHKNKNELENFKQKFKIKDTPTFAIYENKKLVAKLDFEENNGFTPYELEKWITSNLSDE